MEGIKSAILPGVLAYVGVRVAQMFAPASNIGQLVGGAAGAIAGVVISKKV